MREIIVIGAGGYIGSRLMDRFAEHNVDWVRGFDLGIFGVKKQAKNTVIKDVADMSGTVFNNAVVVYLASFHREPDGCASKETWRSAYGGLMVAQPGAIAHLAHQLIYVSSMRAITDRDSLYGETKARAERVLVRNPKARIFRFGTVWGGHSKSLPNRPNTAINFALTRRFFHGDHWTAFTTHISDVVETLYDATIQAASPGVSPDGTVSADITNVIDLPVPLTSHDVRLLLTGQHHNQMLQSEFRKEILAIPRRLSQKTLTEDTTAGARLQQYYGLESK